MLDDNESSESSTSTSTRRRAAGRPAGAPPAALSTDIFAPPAETKADRPAKKETPLPRQLTRGGQETRLPRRLRRRRAPR